MKNKILNYLPIVFSIILLALLFSGCEQQALTAISQSEATNTDVVDDTFTSNLEIVVDNVELLSTNDESKEYRIGVGRRALMYRIEMDGSKSESFIELIESANKGKVPIPLRVTIAQTDKIVNVELPTNKEVTEWQEKRGHIWNKPSSVNSPTFKIELESIINDNIQIDMNHLNQDMRAEKSSRLIFDDYNAVKDAFDNIVSKSCDYDRNTDEYGCISFPYKLDGCFARAHRMKEILEEDYGKWCLKLMVYSQQGLDIPGCSQKWAYHIAPIVFSNSDFTWYVLDPSLGDEPLGIYDWASIMGIHNMCEVEYGSRYIYVPNDRRCYVDHDYDYQFDYDDTYDDLWFFQNYFNCEPY